MAAVSPAPDGIAAYPAVAAEPRRVRPGIRLALRVGGGIAILLITALAVGFGPFVRGLSAVSPWSVLAALALAVVATSAAAWRWRVIAHGYGLDLSRRAAFAAYYRSQFLNAVLPAGVLGDVHRAWAHGRDQARVGVAARAVVVERILGQLVQIALTLAVLLPLGFGSSLVPLAWCAGAIAVVAAVAAAAALLPGRRPMLRREWILLRPVLTRPAALSAIVLASVVVVASHVALFVVASIAVGLPFDGGIAAVGLVVLGASAIPLNVGGWGPREAAAGAAFALVGLGASAGVAASTAFGVLALVGVAPGAVVLLLERRSRS
ncbi:lysylphosphatidylglycerol synthase transmembrane domain-containing protein [Microbacterium sp. NPDC089698]|uniref:lysylphosphatidylglycerol synthase transmembrane domain-containing protein n=1 Tax=Microbacterium sp. NPDC089698 TaxID=3364200 RepID=UPI00382F8BB4